MGYTLEEQYDSYNYTSPENCPAVFKQSRTLDGITIHHWGGLGQRHSDVRDYLSRPNGNTSAHEIISAGLVSTIIAHANAAWHTGNPIGNAKTIGLECRPEATEADYLTVGERVRDIRNLHGLPLPLSPHNYWQNTACPGVWDLAKIDRIANSVTPPVVIAPPPSQIIPPGRYWIVDPGDTLGGIAAYYGVSVDSILALNPAITNPNVITVGQFIDIPEESGYAETRGWIVDPGDTLSGIAAYYGVSVDAIVRLNGISNPDAIYVGQYIRIP